MWIIFLLPCAFLLPVAFGVENKPIIIRGPKVKIINIGESATFVCEADGTPMPSVYWEFNREKIIPDEQFQITEKHHGLSLLRIDKVDLGVDGIICCNAAGGGYITEQCGALKVRRAPTISQQPENQTAELGANVVFTCGTNGYPTPLVDWYHNGILMDCLFYKVDEYCARYSLSLANSLRIFGLTPEDEGQYKCEAANAFGTAESVVAYLAVDVQRNIIATTANPTTPKIDAVSDDPQLVTESPPNTTMDGLNHVHTNVTHLVDMQTFTGGGHEKSFTSRGSFLLIIIFLGFFLVVALLLCKFCKKRRKKITGRTTRAISVCSNRKISGFQLKVQDRKLLQDQLIDLSYPVEKLNIIEELGEGVFGLVFKAIAPDLLVPGQCTTVAVKTVRAGNHVDRVEDFRREAELLSTFRHENIVQLLGVCFDENTKNFPRGISCLLFEYVPGGDLCAYLRSHGPNRELFSSAGMESERAVTEVITDLEKVKICIQIARGMEYLSERNFIHRDLATRNCLISHANKKLKIADFGLSRRTYETDYYKSSHEESVPIRWMAPESILYGKYSSQSDVWAYGVTIWEVYSYALQPYFSLSNEEVICAVCQGRILSAPPDAPSWMYNLMQLCWQRVFESRPTFTNICTVLESILENGTLPISPQDGATDFNVNAGTPQSSRHSHISTVSSKDPYGILRTPCPWPSQISSDSGTSLPYPNCPLSVSAPLIGGSSRKTESSHSYRLSACSMKQMDTPSPHFSTLSNNSSLKSDKESIV